MLSKIFISVYVAIGIVQILIYLTHLINNYLSSPAAMFVAVVLTVSIGMYLIETCYKQIWGTNQ